MADVTISDLATAASLAGTDVFELEQGATSYKTLLSSISTFIIDDLLGEERVLQVGGGSGGTAWGEADDFVVDLAGNGGISIIGGNASVLRLFFGDVADDNVGGITYTHSTDRLAFRAAGIDDILEIGALGAYLNGYRLYLDADDDTYFDAGSDDTLVLNLGSLSGKATFSSTLTAFKGGVVQNTNESGAAYFRVNRNQSHGSNQYIGILDFFGQDSASNNQTFAQIEAYCLDHTSASEDAELRLRAYVAGTLTQTLTVGNGVKVGSPTGGYQGAGTINVATDLYKNGTRYTDPDYVFEHYYRGRIEKFKDNAGASDYPGVMGLLDVEQYVSEHLQLPRIPDRPTGVFDRADILLEKTEEVFIHLIDHEKRLRALEARHGSN